MALSMKPRSQQIWLPKKINQMDKLPDDKLYEICEILPTEDLISLSKSYKRASILCFDILNKRRSTERLSFEFTIHDNEIKFERDLNGVIISALIVHAEVYETPYRPKTRGYYKSRENQILRINEYDQISDIPLIENTAEGGGTIIPLISHGYYLLDFSDGIMHILEIHNLENINHIDLYSHQSGPIEIARYNVYIHKLILYISKVNLDMTGYQFYYSNIRDFKLEYYYDSDSRVYSFMVLKILMENRSFVYHSNNDGTISFSSYDPKTRKMIKKTYDEEEFERRSGFAFRVYEGSMNLRIPKAEADIIARHLFEFSVFIDFFPISNFLNILRS